MSNNNATQEPKGAWKYPYSFTERWVSAVMYVISGPITYAIAAVITAMTIILVVLGGLWLTYAYLPTKVFILIAAVLLVDILFGIAVRAIVKPR